MRPGLGTVLRTLGHAPATGGTPPSAPTVTAVNDETGTSITLTIDGDAGATNYAYYRAYGTAGWTAGLSRSGDGDIQQTGLTAETLYHAFAISKDAEDRYSLPSDVVEIRTTVPAADASDLSGTATSTTANTFTDTGKTFPTAGDGRAGVPVLWLDGDAEGVIGIILSNTATEITVDANWDTQPAAGDKYAIGAIPFRFATGWLDLRRPADNIFADTWKRVRTATVFMNNDNTIVADLTLELYADLDDTTPLSTAAVDLREDRVKVALPGYGRHFMLVGYNNDVDVPIRILKIVLDVVFPEN